MVDVDQSGSGGAPRVRLAGRVIMLGPDDLVLLFRYDDGPPNGGAKQLTYAPVAVS